MKHAVIILLFASVMTLASGAGRDAGHPAPAGTAPDAGRTGSVSLKARLERAEGSVDAMGSTFSIVAYGEDAGRLQAAVEAALEESRRLDRLLSNYLPDSEWSQVNREAASHPVRVSPELYRLLAECIEYSRESEGAFDISVGPLMKVWGFYKGSGHLPHRAEVFGALARTGYRNLRLDPANSSVQFARDGVEIDPGGIGKGYAVDRMVDVLRENGVRAALVSGGGSSIYALGTPPGETGWKVNIKDPRNTSKTAAVAILTNQSMSTSGNYEKFFYAEGKMYSHIMDPRTGYPSMGTLSVSVVTPKTIDSEAWCKPYYVLGRQWTVRHKPKDFRVFFCEDRSGVPCAWLQ